MPTLQEIIEQLLASPDQLALYYLDKFMMQGFPSPDIDKQVALAYAYAESIIRYKNEKYNKEQMIENITLDMDSMSQADSITCPKCAEEIYLMPVNTLNGSQVLYVCTKCGFQTDDPKTLIIAPRSNGNESNASTKES